jgi:hypothetical protein
MGYNAFRDDKNYNPKYGNNGRVKKDEFSIDGKSWNYRDPSNTKYSDGHIADRIGDDGSAEDYGNRNSYGYTNPLYDYSYGQTRDAAEALGINNVNNKDDVNNLLDYMRNGPEQEEDPFDESADDQQTVTAITPDEPYEPSEELLKQAGILADWEAGYGAGGNKSPYKSNFQDMAFDSEAANPYRVKSEADQFMTDYKNDLKDVFQFTPTIA